MLISKLAIVETYVGLSDFARLESSRGCMTSSSSEAAELIVDVHARLLDVRGRTMGREPGDARLSAMDGAVLAGEDGRDPLGGQGKVMFANRFGKPGDSGGISSFGTAKLD
jgi:hypothetical protein